MSKTSESNRGPRTVATNRKARHEYFIEETYEAGIVLTGTEIKSVRRVKVHQDAKSKGIILFDRDHSWDERILAEQFQY